MSGGGSVVDRIAAVQRAHRTTERWWADRSAPFGCSCTEWSGRDLDAHDTHVAGEVAKALQLEEERRTFGEFETEVQMGGEGDLRYGGQTSRYVGQRTQSRLVSPWVSVPQEEQ